jgi:DNA-binding beta-propeller fold protein YncE
LSAVLAAAAAAMLALATGCASRYAAPTATRSVFPETTASALPAEPGAGSLFGGIFANPDLTVAGGALYLRWDRQPSGPRGVPPREVLDRVDPVTGQATARNMFSPGWLSPPVAAAGALWLTDSTAAGRVLLRLDPATLMVTGELRIPRGEAPGAADLGQQLAFAGGSLWADGGTQLLRISPATAAVTAVIPLTAGALAAGLGASPDGGTLVVSETGTGSGAVQLRDPETGAVLASAAMAGPASAAIGGVTGTSVWVAQPTGNSGFVERLSLATMTPDLASDVGGTNAIRARVADGALWVTDGGGGTAGNYCASAATGRVLAPLPIPDTAQARLLAVAGGHLYYAVPATAGSRIRTVPVPAACR